MVKVFAQASFGIFMLFMGVYIIFIYEANLSQNSSFLLLIASALLIGFSAAFFFYAYKTLKSNKAEAGGLASDSTSAEALGKAIQRNNAMVAEWSKTDSARNKLKILQAAGGAGEGQ